MSDERPMTIIPPQPVRLEFRPPGKAALPRLLTLAATLVIALMLLVILGHIAWGGLGTIDWEFLTSPPHDGMMSGGIFPAIIGTFFLVILMTIAVVPIGVMSAVYLHEFARPDSRMLRVIRVAINNLAGVPSIVFGLFGLGFFVAFVGGNLDAVFFPDEGPVWGQPAIIWASLTLAILTLPTMIVTTEEALASIPRELKEASLALGASRLQTIGRVILPQARPGILTGIILSVSRGAGEVAPIMFTGVAYYLPYIPTRLNDQFMELGYHIYVMATQSPDIDRTRPILYGTVLVLLLLTLVLNFIAIMIRSRLRSKADQ
jgi:phosphate transport system permease protein